MRFTLKSWMDLYYSSKFEVTLKVEKSRWIYITDYSRKHLLKSCTWWSVEILVFVVVSEQR